MPKPREQMTDAQFLRDLAARMMAIPVSSGVDQADCDRLEFIASQLEDGEPNF